MNYPPSDDTASSDAVSSGIGYKAPHRFAENLDKRGRTGQKEFEPEQDWCAGKTPQIACVGMLTGWRRRTGK